MRDNKPSEFMAEQYISSELLKYDIKTSKPYFDENGTDLLIIDQVNRSETAILRVQSKGRRYAKSKPSNVTIPQNYVSTNFLLGLYVVDEHYLYIMEIVTTLFRAKLTQGLADFWVAANAIKARTKIVI